LFIGSVFGFGCTDPAYPASPISLSRREKRFSSLTDVFGTGITVDAEREFRGRINVTGKKKLRLTALATSAQRNCSRGSAEAAW